NEALDQRLLKSPLSRHQKSVASISTSSTGLFAPSAPPTYRRRQSIRSRLTSPAPLHRLCKVGNSSTGSGKARRRSIPSRSLEAVQTKLETSAGSTGLRLPATGQTGKAG